MATFVDSSRESNVAATDAAGDDGRDDPPDLPTFDDLLSARKLSRGPQKRTDPEHVSDSSDGSQREPYFFIGREFTHATL